MDVYILDEFLRRTVVIDYHESFIWTERYREIGDFQLVVRSDRAMRNLLTAGTRLAINESRRTMVIETIEDKTTDDGTKVIEVSGSSIENILENRSAWQRNVELWNTDPWNYIDTPGNIVRRIFMGACVDGLTSEKDRIPFYKPGSLSPSGNIPEPTEVVNIGFDVQSAYDAISKVCEVYNLGFRLVRNGDKSELYFEVYTGNDRTSIQTILDPVIFSPELDNLTDTTELTATSDYKNVAYVIGDMSTVTVYADGVTENVSGFDRRVLMVKATDVDTGIDHIQTLEELDTEMEKFYDDLSDRRPEDVDSAVAEYRAYLESQGTWTSAETDGFAATYRQQFMDGDVETIRDAVARRRAQRTALRDSQMVVAMELYEIALAQKGKEELAKHRAVVAFDGEIRQNSAYKYDVHYSLGDVVVVRNADGFGTNMRVTEQIFVSDKEGDRSYPTLTTELLITPGSWLSGEGQAVWLDADGTWSEA